MINRRLLTGLMALVVVVSAMFVTLTMDARLGHACIFQPEPAPAEGMSSGPDCAWRFPDGKTYDEEFQFQQRMDLPLYILLPLALAIPISVMIPNRAWKPLWKRLVHEAGRTLNYFTPGNSGGGSAGG